MHLNKILNDQAFIEWINVLESSVDVFKKQYPELYNFWFENFTLYLTKLKKRVKKTNPRRNFQGQIVNYLLSVIEPTCIINLFTGALRNLHDTFNQVFFSSNTSNMRREDKKTQDKFFFWINIDLLPTSIRANCEYLETTWGVSSYPISNTKYAYYTIWPNGIMLHLCGDLSELPTYYTNIIDVASQYHHKLLLGIEGIMNLPIFTKERFMIWWSSFGELITHFDAFFGSWMAAGDQWAGLKTKIIFYQDVVKVNHQQPLSYGQMVQFIQNDDILIKKIILFKDKLPWNVEQVDNCIKNISPTVEGIILEYYTSTITYTESLRFISSYVTELGLLHLCQRIVASEYVLKVGYSDWNNFMGKDIDSKRKEKTGFVKIFPFGFIHKNVLNKK